MKVTINHVARFCGVSKSTVSRVLNNSGPVSEEVRRKVSEAVQFLNFEPNFTARSLVKQETRTIGVLVPDMRNPFYAKACWAAERYARSRRYVVMIGSSDNNYEEGKFMLDFFKERRVDFFLSVGGGSDMTNIINFRATSSIPLVLVDRKVEGYNIPSVLINNRLGGRMVAEYLLSLGHERTALVSSDFIHTETERRKGFEQRIMEAGQFVKSYQPFIFTEDQWKAEDFCSLEYALKSDSPPTAIFATNDLKALRMYSLAYRLGLKIPRDISIVGFDDIDVANLLAPPLTTVHLPVEELIYKAMELLLSDQPQKGNQIYVFDPCLVIRKSAGPPKKG